MSAKPKNSGKKGAKRPIDTHHLFVHAEGFRLAAEILRKEFADGKLIYICPFHMTDAFCCEIYLKLLVTIATGQHPHGHNLEALFSKVPVKYQDAVEKHFEELSKADLEYKKAGLAGPSKANDLRVAFKDGRELFEKIRYSYEGDFPDSRGDFRWPVMAIRNVILEIHPHWTPQVENWTKPKSAARQKRTQEPLAGSILPVCTPILIPRPPRR